MDISLNKINKRRINLDTLPLYAPPQRDFQCELDTFIEMTPEEIHTNTMYCNSDPFPTNLIKLNPDILIPITRLVNKSLTSGEFLKDWKISIIKPLIKKGTNTKLSNYRPINNLSFMSKVVERSMLKQLNNYLNTNMLVPTYISGYRQDYSIETALLKLCLDILNGMDYQEITCLIAMDLSAAFDIVHHNILLKVLNSYDNISNTALKWITSYLSDRQAYINVNNIDSDRHLMDFSVPKALSLDLFISTYMPVLWNHI